MLDPGLGGPAEWAGPAHPHTWSPVTRTRPFAQVDVFTRVPYAGNPVAVVLDGTDLDSRAMRAFAAWTNLSETTFVLPPSDPRADYRLRIFTPGGELPFAGHPTLGSAHAWWGAGGRPSVPDEVVQECGAGLVPIRREGDTWSFRAPDLVREGPLDDDLLDTIAAGLRIPRAEIVGHQWVDNGPGWAAVRMPTAQAVLDLEPDHGVLGDLVLGVVGTYPEGSERQLEVRAFCGGVGVVEDPVTGSLQASVAQWLTRTGVLPPDYRAGQGRRVGRDGDVQLRTIDGRIWAGGACVTCIRGTVDL
nr:PhzF family phenazine biosynthesis protein [Nakamurella flavida]